MNSLASRLRDARTQRGLSQRDLARKAGVGTTTISSIEQGRSRGTTLIVPIAKALGVREEWLVSGKGQKESSGNNGATSGQDYYVAARSLEELAEQLVAKGNDHVARLIELVMQIKDKRR